MVSKVSVVSKGCAYGFKGVSLRFQKYVFMVQKRVLMVSKVCVYGFKSVCLWSQTCVFMVSSVCGFKSVFMVSKMFGFKSMYGFNSVCVCAFVTVTVNVLW